MIHNTLIVACVVAAAAPGLAGGEDAKLAAVLDDVDRRAAQTADLSGHFRQEKFTALLKKPLISSGRIRMKGPVVRWDTERPEPAVLHSDGREIRMYYPKQSVVEVYPIDRRLADLVASPLPRLAALRQHFRIEPAPPHAKSDTPRDNPSAIEIQLTPTDDFLAQHVDHVRVTLDVSRAFVTRVEMLDGDGDRTVIQFTDLKTDTGIKDADLELSLPPGTKVSRPLDGTRADWRQSDTRPGDSRK
jgi:outer membrane lipoprotein-sorting protein